MSKMRGMECRLCRRGGDGSSSLVPAWTQLSLLSAPKCSFICVTGGPVSATWGCGRAELRGLDTGSVGGRVVSVHWTLRHGWSVLYVRAYTIVWVMGEG